MSKRLTITPSLRVVPDVVAADRLRELIKDADDGMRRILKCGLYIEWMAAVLPNGQLLKWIELHCPDVGLSTVYRWRSLAKNVCEWAGFEFSQWENLPFSGDKLLELPSTQLPHAVQAAREKMDLLLDSAKTPKQLFLDLGFKSGDLDEHGYPRKKAGRTKGCKGTTKEQRQAAREREEQERIEEIEITAGEFCKWMEKVGGPKGVGLIGNGPFKKLRSTVDWFGGVLDQLHDQRGEK